MDVGPPRAKRPLPGQLSVPPSLGNATHLLKLRFLEFEKKKEFGFGTSEGGFILWEKWRMLSSFLPFLKKIEASAFHVNSTFQSNPTSLLISSFLNRQERRCATADRVFLRRRSEPESALEVYRSAKTCTQPTENDHFFHLAIRCRRNFTLSHV